MTEEHKGTRPSKSGDELPDFLTTKQAADLTNVSVSWYKKARYNGYGPPLRKAGTHRQVREGRAALLVGPVKCRSRNPPATLQ